MNGLLSPADIQATMRFNQRKHASIRNALTTRASALVNIGSFESTQIVEIQPQTDNRKLKIAASSLLAILMAVLKDYASARFTRFFAIFRHLPFLWKQPRTRGLGRLTTKNWNKRGKDGITTTNNAIPPRCYRPARRHSPINMRTSRQRAHHPRRRARSPPDRRVLPTRR